MRLTPASGVSRTPNMPHLACGNRIWARAGAPGGRGRLPRPGSTTRDPRTLVHHACGVDLSIGRGAARRLLQRGGTVGAANAAHVCRVRAHPAPLSTASDCGKRHRWHQCRISAIGADEKHRLHRRSGAAVLEATRLLAEARARMRPREWLWIPGVVTTREHVVQRPLNS
jgi:hypothetical protein